jgi:transaldolase
MGASFRNVGEIEALAGCDRLTIAPALMDELAASSESLRRALSPVQLNDAQPWVRYDQPRFRLALNEDAMATEKLAERIRLFSKDLYALCALVRSRIAQDDVGMRAVSPASARLAEVGLERQAAG